MSNCTGCFHETNDGPSNAEECKICIRNPKYPTQIMPEKALLDGLEVSVPQDMYISKDRLLLEERRWRKREADLLNLLRKEDQPKTPDYPYPWLPQYPDPYNPPKYYRQEWTVKETGDDTTSKQE